jgi:cytochrome oxidase Cu insertion factor (SCO1/SenC/PrrC family)
MRTYRLITALVAFSLAAWVSVTASAGGDGKMIPVGQPFVEFELAANDGSTVSSAELTGRPFLLFFYPKAATPG